MAATRWEYETVNVSQEDVKHVLNRFGEKGYQIVHISEKPEGGYYFILGRDTGRPTDEERPNEWLVEAVTGESTLPGLTT